MKTNRQAALVAAIALSLLTAQAAAKDAGPTPKAEPKTKVEVKAEPEAKAVPKVAPKVIPRVVTKATPKLTPKVTPKTETKVETKVEVKAAEAKETPASQPAKDLMPKRDIPEEMDPEDVSSLIKGAIKAAKGGQWALLVGLILMLATWLVNRLLKSKIPPKVLPWVSIGLGVAAQIALTVGAGDVKSADTWISAISGGIALGLTGAGGWSALGKYLPGIRKKAKVEDKPAEGSS